MQYAVQAWSPRLCKDIKKLEDVQRRAIRMTSGLTGTLYEDKLKEAGMLSLEARRLRGDSMIQVWKVLNKYDKVDEEKWFRRVDTDRQIATRLSTCPYNLQLNSVRLDTRKHFFSQRVVTQWNNLHEIIKESPTLNEFKNNYDFIVMAD